MDPAAALGVALIAAVPATIAALASWRQAKKTRGEISTNHGLRAGEYIEAIAHQVGVLKANQEIAVAQAHTYHLAQTEALREHTAQDAERFEALQEEIQAIKDAL